MAKTRVVGKVEWFDGAIQSNGITTMTPGAFAPVIAVQRRGARNASMGVDGRSGRVKDVEAEYIWSPPDANHIFTLECWLNIKSIGTTPSGAGSLNFNFSIRRDNEESFIFGHQGNRQIVVRDASVGDRYTGFFLTRGIWEYWVIVGSLVASTLVEWRIYKKPLGGAFTLIDSRVANFGVFGNPKFKFWNSIVGAGNRWAGAVSAMSMYQLDAFADATVMPADVIDPPAASITINLSPSGSPTNDGTPAAPILVTVSRLNEEIKYGTLDNDTVSVDATNWDVGASVVMSDWFNSSDVTLTIIGQPKLHADISGPNTVWTLHSGTIWKTTDNGSTDLTDVIVIEDGHDIPHPAGINIAAVSAALEAGTGYFSDGVYIYYVASDHSNPNTNNKKILRSRDRNGSNSLHVRNVRNITINNWFAFLTMQVQHDNNNIPKGGSIAIEDVCTGYVNLVDCGGDWCGEQCFGRGTIGADLVVRRIRPRYPYVVDVNGNVDVAASDKHLHPYCPIGSAQPDVDEPTDASTTQTAEYINGVCGCSNAWTSHSDAGLLASVTFTGCNFNKGTISTQGIVSNTIINSSVVGAIANAKVGNVAPAGPVVVNHSSKVLGPISGSQITLNPGVEWIPAFTCQTGNLNQQVFGAINLITPTVDASGCVAGDTTASLFYRIAAATLTVKGIIYKKGGNDIALAANFALGEIVSDYNGVEAPVGDRWLENYNGADKTGTQAIATGLDTHSVFNANGKVLAPAYKLASTSPFRNIVSIAAVPGTSGALDFYNKPGPVAGNRDAGAVLYNPSHSGKKARLMLTD